MLAGLSEVLADPVAALDELGRILGVKGRVLPMCPIALQIEADVSGLEGDPRMFRLIRGQVAIATTPGKVRRVRLLPDNAPATRQAVDAIMAADLVVLGPGSWFTSVIPHVLVPGLAAALRATTARRALVLNLVAEPGETAGFSVERHLHVLAQHAPEFSVHDIIIDAERVPSERERDQLRRTATLLSAEVHFADVARPGTPLHDPGKLAAALDGVRAAHKAPGASPVTATADIRVDGASPPAGGVDRPAADQGVTTRGDDDRSQGRTEPPHCEIGQRAPGGSHVPAEVRRRAAHRRWPRRGRSRGGPGQRRAPVTQGHFRTLRLQRRRACVVGQRDSQEHPIRVAGGQRRRGAGAPDRPARQPRPPGARTAGPGGGRQRRRLPKPRGGEPSWRTGR